MPFKERAERLGATAAFIPLRLFLGGTFTFAGLQKLANPNFFNHSSPISIWAQLVGAERTSPIHALLGHLLKVATPLGAMIAFGEVAIGVGILLGLLTRVAAAGGMLLSFGLFLTVSFHSNPYYTGADIVFFFALTPLLLGGPGEILALDPALRRKAQQQVLLRRKWTEQSRPGLAGAAAGAEADFEPERRALLAKAVAAVGALAVVAVGLDGSIGRLLGRAQSATTATPQLGGGSPATTTPSTAATAPSTTAATATTTAGTRGSPPTTAGPPSTTAGAGPGSTAAPSTQAVPAGKALGPAKDVPVGGAAMFQDPATGDPGIVIQQNAGQFVAFDAVCPHAGCTVGYSSANNLIVCPCHGSEFNPATGALVAGPAPHGLTPIQVAVGPNGDLYAV